VLAARELDLTTTWRAIQLRNGNPIARLAMLGAEQIMKRAPASTDLVAGPLGPRRAIADALKKLRAKEKKSLRVVAGDLGVSTSKLSRLENAQGKVYLPDIQYLIQYYQIDGTPQAEQLKKWTEAAQETGWWKPYGDVVAGTLDTHLAYEVNAVVERVYTIPFVPVLLQTLSYAQAVLRDMEHRPETEIRKLLEVRVRRQQALSRSEGRLRLLAVTHETTLRQVVGSRSVMREQLDALLEHSERPNVDLRVMPFTAPPTFGMTCMWAYFQYSKSGASDIVSVETPSGFRSLDDPKEVRKYRSAHIQLMKVSHDKEGSLELIKSVRDEMMHTA
jgi:transcriptional regulator with XRE-family HTH domain